MDFDFSIVAGGSGYAILDMNGHRGIHLKLDITAASGTDETLDLKLQKRNGATGDWEDLSGAALAQKTATGIDDLYVHPFLTSAVANRSVIAAIPDEVKIVWTIGGTTPSFTFTLNGNFK
jgi:hypothetical protein